MVGEDVSASQTTFEVAVLGNVSLQRFQSVIRIDMNAYKYLRRRTCGSP